MDGTSQTHHALHIFVFRHCSIRTTIVFSNVNQCLMLCVCLRPDAAFSNVNQRLMLCVFTPRRCVFKFQPVSRVMCVFTPRRCVFKCQPVSYAVCLRPDAAQLLLHGEGWGASVGRCGGADDHKHADEGTRGRGRLAAVSSDHKHALESMRGRGRLAAVSSDDGTSSCERLWDKQLVGTSRWWEQAVARDGGTSSCER